MKSFHHDDWDETLKCDACSSTKEEGGGCYAGQSFLCAECVHRLRQQWCSLLQNMINKLKEELNYAKEIDLSDSVPCLNNE